MGVFAASGCAPRAAAVVLSGLSSGQRSSVALSTTQAQTQAHDVAHTLPPVQRHRQHTPSNPAARPATLAPAPAPATSTAANGHGCTEHSTGAPPPSSFHHNHQKNNPTSTATVPSNPFPTRQSWLDTALIIASHHRHARAEPRKHAALQVEHAAGRQGAAVDDLRAARAAGAALGGVVTSAPAGGRATPGVKAGGGAPLSTARSSGGAAWRHARLWTAVKRGTCGGGIAGRSQPTFQAAFSERDTLPCWRGTGQG